MQDIALPDQQQTVFDMVLEMDPVVHGVVVDMAQIAIHEKNPLLMDFGLEAVLWALDFVAGSVAFAFRGRDRSLGSTNPGNDEI